MGRQGKQRELLDMRHPESMDAEEIAELVGKSVRTIHHWAQVGKLPEPCAYLHGARRWNRDVIERWLSER